MINKAEYPEGFQIHSMKSVEELGSKPENCKYCKEIDRSTQELGRRTNVSQNHKLISLKHLKALEMLLAYMIIFLPFPQEN